MAMGLAWAQSPHQLTTSLEVLILLHTGSETNSDTERRIQQMVASASVTATSFCMEDLAQVRTTFPRAATNKPRNTLQLANQMAQSTVLASSLLTVSVVETKSDPPAAPL